MLRAIIVLPVYLAAMYLVPQTEWYGRFHATVLSSQPYLQWHLIGYGAALVIAVIWALFLEFGKQPQTYWTAVFTQVLKLGVIGVMVTSAWQLFQFFSGGELSVIMLLVPPIFMVAEMFYLFVEFIIAAFQGRRVESAARQG
jgi:hypothetical protein